MKNVYIFSIETSCDETSMAIIKNGEEVISLTILSQMNIHANYGGVVPEVASRMHSENITLVYEETLRKANMNITECDAIAVTYAPGLSGSLLVGVEFAKTLSLVYKIPLIKVNHLIGHIYANNLSGKLKFPLLALVVSGGHTELIQMDDDYCFKKLGETLDDAIGESYDKVARILGMKYPGGPNVEKAALIGNDSYKLPKMVQDNSYNFSYSGLKSSVINTFNKNPNNIKINDLACSFQVKAVEQLTRKLELAFKNTKIRNVVIAGGVSANKYLQNEIKKTCKKYGATINLPEQLYCTDNAAMIGAAAYPLFIKGEFSDLSLEPNPNLDIC